ncbi:MAG: SDR family NAD(P)-dependent oxidoreductase [Lutibacter sp.]|jgi:benzil reductase ((S)-benzoin forming)|nr:SDR family NAD(P)-dependent oxidoreductase [Lutibacter sp.]
MENVVIITGASRGLGLGLAQYYHKKGYRIISIARTKLKKYYAFEQYQADLSKAAHLDPLMEEVFSQLNPENTSSISLINNAGNLGKVRHLEDIPSANIHYTIQVNLVAPMVLSAAFIRLTKDWKCHKQIFSISSGAAVKPYESWSMYCSSKAGIDMMTRVVSKEQQSLGNGVKMVAIYPGIVDTDMQTEVRNTPKEHFSSVQRFIDFYENGALSSPEKAAAKIYELDCSGRLENGDIIDLRNY